MSEHWVVARSAQLPAASAVRLDALGVGRLAEQVYAALLRSTSTSLRVLSRLLRADPADVGRALTELGKAGLVTALSADQPAYDPGAGVGPSGPAEIRYTARPPLPVLGSALQDRLARLVCAGAAVEQFGHTYASRAEPITVGRDVATVVGGFVDVEHAVHQLLAGATHELLTLDRQPFVRSAQPHALPSAMFDLLRRGVDVRTIYAADAFRVAGYADYRAEAARLGEHARPLAHLPLRCIVADRTTAMLPLEADGPWVSAALVVRGPTMVDDIARVFDELWERAAAAPATSAPDPADLDETELTLLSMLADDMTEGAIGRYLGASPRTVSRRMARLQDKLGAPSRFALGAEAARRGLV